MFSGGVLLFLFLPLFAVVAIVIKRKSPGPIFFRQKRTGMDGKDFWCLKFRSMHVNDQADTLQASENDPRKYPFGDFMRRTNIDELPQFYNVLKGDMALIGPRPPLTYHPWELSEYTAEQRRMFEVIPGITGWAQVHGRKDVEWNKRIRLNVWYVDHVSLWLDIKIFFKTIQTVLKHENLYTN